MIAGHLLGIAAKQNVRAAAGHVGGHGDSAFASSLRYDAGFAFVLLGVEHLVRDAGFLQQVRDGFGFFDGDSADQHRLAALVILANAVRVGIVFLQDAGNDRHEFSALGAIDNIGILFADERAIRGNYDDVEVVNLPELGGFGFRGTGHAGKLFVHAEIILEGDGGEGLVLAFDLHAFFCFDGLVQAVRPAATGHLASGKFIDDDNLAVLDHVIDIIFVQRVRAQRLVNVVHQLDVCGIGKIGEVKQAFALAEAFFGQCGLTVLFVNRVVDFLDQLGNDFVDFVVFVGRFFGGTGNDQRGARFVDQNRVHFIDDGEVMRALDAVRQVVLHVVAEIVEAEFVIGAVSDVRAVSRAALFVVEVVDDNANAEAEATIERAHPFGVAAGEIIVHSDDVHAASGERIEASGKGGDERLAFTRFHFRDFAFVEHHAADELHIEMTHVQKAAASFANQRESGRDGRLERAAKLLFVGVLFGRIGVLELFLNLRFQLRKARFQLFVGERFGFRFARVDGGDERLNFFDVALMLGADELGDELIDKFRYIHEGLAVS